MGILVGGWVKVGLRCSCACVPFCDCVWGLASVGFPFFRCRAIVFPDSVQMIPTSTVNHFKKKESS